MRLLKNVCLTTEVYDIVRNTCAHILICVSSIFSGSLFYSLLPRSTLAHYVTIILLLYVCIMHVFDAMS